MPSRPRFQPLARAVLRTQTDARLVALAREGKEAAFEEIVRRYRAGLVVFAAAYGPPDAEDVVQESFVRSWDALRGSTGEMHLKAWLYTIVRNRALNARRDARPHEQLSDQLDGVRQPLEIVLTNEELGRAVAAVAALPNPQREALVRSALEGHTHQQIAASIGSTPGAVRQLIYRARLSVRHGVGALIPLPLVGVLAELGTAGAGVGTATGGATVAGAAGGASLATKSAVIAAIGIVAAGSGVAIERSQRSKDGGERHSLETQRDQRRPAGSHAAAASTGLSAPAELASGDGGAASGQTEPVDDHSGGSGAGGPGSDDSGSSAQDSGSSESGSGSSGSGSGSSGSSGSGSGSSGSGSSGSGSSGSGHDDGAEPPEPPEPPEPAEAAEPPEPPEPADEHSTTTELESSDGQKALTRALGGD